MMRPRMTGAPARTMRAVPVDQDARGMDLAAEVYRATCEAWPQLVRAGGPSRSEAARLAYDLMHTPGGTKEPNAYGIVYDEDLFHQFVRMPWRTLEDGRTDCKSSAVLIGSTCKAAGCDVALRFIINPGEQHYGHVYAIIDGTAVDPLLEFGQEAPNIGSETIPIHG